MGAALEKEYQQKGFGALMPIEGMKALKACMGQALPVIQVAHIDWEQLESDAPWLKKVIQKKESAYLVELLEKTSGDKRNFVLQKELERFLRSIQGCATGVPPENCCAAFSSIQYRFL